MPLRKNSKTDSSDLRKKYLNHQLSIAFAKYLIKFHEILSNSLKEMQPQMGQTDRGHKAKISSDF